MYVTDNAVARVIAQVRRVLGDSARGSRYIETVPTRGYRFIVPVHAQVRRWLVASPATRVPVATEASWARGSELRLNRRSAGTGNAVGGGRQLHATRNPTPRSAPTAGTRSGPRAWRSWHCWRLPRLAIAGRRPRGSRRRCASATRTQITSSASLDAFPAWSPDGRTLAYASDRGGRFEIFIRDLTAGGDRSWR